MRRLNDIDPTGLETEDADDVDPERLDEQLQEMDRVTAVRYHETNGFFAGVDIELQHNQPDMLCEIAVQHGLRYRDSYIQAAHNKGRQPEERTHRVKFVTDIDARGALMTARETQAEGGEAVGEPF